MAFSIALGGSIYRTRWLYHPHRWLNLFAILIKTEKDFQLLKNDIQRTLDNNEPQLALDRTHTLLVTYFRKLCTKHGIVYNEKETVDNLFSKHTGC